MDSKDVEEIFKGVLTDENQPNPGYQVPAPVPSVHPPPAPTGKCHEGLPRSLTESVFFIQ